MVDITTPNHMSNTLTLFPSSSDDSKISTQASIYDLSSIAYHASIGQKIRLYDYDEHRNLYFAEEIYTFVNVQKCRGCIWVSLKAYNGEDTHFNTGDDEYFFAIES